MEVSHKRIERLKKSSGRVLIIDNNRIILKLLRNIIFSCGYDVVISGVDALISIAFRKYDIVILPYDIDDGLASRIAELVRKSEQQERKRLRKSDGFQSFSMISVSSTRTDDECSNSPIKIIGVQSNYEWKRSIVSDSNLTCSMPVDNLRDFLVHRKMPSIPRTSLRLIS